MSVIDRDRDGVRVRDRTPDPGAYAIGEHVVRNLLAPEEISAFGHYPVNAMSQVTGRGASRARENARRMRHLIARERAPPPTPVRVEYKHQPRAQPQAADSHQPHHRRIHRAPAGAPTRSSAEWDDRIHPIIHLILLSVPFSICF